MISNVNENKVSDIFLFGEYFDIDANIFFEPIYNQRSNKKPFTRAKK